jgi:CRISPR/Cas system-associated endonuclease Cas3-HD
MVLVYEKYNFYKEIDSIDYSNFNILNVKHSDMFDYIYKYTPETLKKYIDSLKNIDQRIDYHPEITVYNHTKAVTNRLSETNDINLILSGYLHDTGKDRTQKIENGIIMQPGHEKYSTQLLNLDSPWRRWIRKLDGNPYIIRFIIRNHMKMKDMKHNNKNTKWFNNLPHRFKYYLNKFNESDKGGFYK